MKISVALCTYNGERYLPSQLRTLAEQLVLPAELVVCDDGSTDGTLRILEEFQASAPFAVRVYKNERNLGSTKNFERALGLCTRELIALCDQDDLWMPEKLKRAEEELRAHPEVGAVFSNARLMDEHDEILSQVLWDRARFNDEDQRDYHRSQNYFFIRRALVTGATLVFRASLLPALVPFPPDFVHDEWMALMLSAVSSLMPIHEYLIAYRLHPAQQVGLDTVPVRTAIHFGREQRLVHQRRMARRFAAAADRLAPLPGTEKSVRYARDKAAYMESRARLLERHRLTRLFTGIRALPGHFRHGSGIVSYFRDLLHE